jgi:hypothetical protein
MARGAAANPLASLWEVQMETIMLIVNGKIDPIGGVRVLAPLET